VQHVTVQKSPQGVVKFTFNKCHPANPGWIELGHIFRGMNRRLHFFYPKPHEREMLFLFVFFFFWLIGKLQEHSMSLEPMTNPPF
jgi:hypothetical protein